MTTKTATKSPATPLFAVVGVTDLAVERVREARLRAEKARTELQADLAPTAVQKRAEIVIEDVKALPTKALNQGVATADQVTKGYEDLAVRGEKLVTRIKNQKATKDLVAQAETTLSLGKGAVTTARKAVLDVRSSALATFTTGRKEATHVAQIVVDTVAEDAEFAATEVQASAKRTRTAAKRTTTTATKARKRTATSAKATTTSAKKAAASTTKATAKAADKVGN
jgi:heparin binding hemagglutinin HbhA